MEQGRLYEAIRIALTDDEIRKLGEALARETQNLHDLRVQKTGALAALAAAIKESEKTIGELTIKINTRSTIIDVEVAWTLDSPRPGMKTLVRIDNPDEIIRIEAMTTAEMQSSFGFRLDDDEEKHK